MEKPSFVRHGMLRLPPGFRFHPTDEELVVQYLERKAYSCPLPASIIPEIDFKNYDPWELPGGREEIRYFFSLRESKYRDQNRSNRAAGSGYWKATGKEKAVMASRCNQVVGMKKVLVFYRGKPKTRTDWIMHEYRLAGPTTNSNIFPQRNNSTHNFMVPSGDWVLCRIFKKKRAARKENEIEDDEQARTRSENTILIDLMRLRDNDDRRPLPPSSSESSCVTELSDGSSDGDEANSTRRSSPP